MRSIYLAIIMVLSCVFTQKSHAEALDKIKMTATEWPPFTGEDLPGQGISSIIVRETFAEMGYDLEIDFSPWQRSLASALTDQDYVGTVIIYNRPRRAETCHLSRPVGISEVGFVQHRNNPIVWKELQDLAGLSIGVVMGYVNTDEFDALADQQKLDVSAVYNDVLNLRRVAYERVDLAVIDRHAMKYFLDVEPDLKRFRNKLEFNPRLLVTHELAVCFKKNKRGRKLRDAFNVAFDPVRAQALTVKGLSAFSKE